MLFKFKKLQSPLYSFCKAEDKISIYIFFIGAEKLPFYGDNSGGFLVPVSIFLRGGSRTSATSKMELFVIIVNGWKPLTIIPKSSTLDVAAVLDPHLVSDGKKCYFFGKNFVHANWMIPQVIAKNYNNFQDFVSQ